MLNQWLTSERPVRIILGNHLNSVLALLLKQHCDVTLIYRPKALLCVTPVKLVEAAILS